jgi:hypothetical protein
MQFNLRIFDGAAKAASWRIAVNFQVSARVAQTLHLCLPRLGLRVQIPSPDQLFIIISNRYNNTLFGGFGFSPFRPRQRQTIDHSHFDALSEKNLICAQRIAMLSVGGQRLV